MGGFRKIRKARKIIQKFKEILTSAFIHANDHTIKRGSKIFFEHIFLMMVQRVGNKKSYAQINTYFKKMKYLLATAQGINKKYCKMNIHNILNRLTNS